MSLKDQIMMDIAEDIKKLIQNEIDSEDMNYTGQLRESWVIEKDDDGDLIVASPLLWAAVMDDGRTPGKMPPVRVLMPWVFQKIGGKDEHELKGIAFAITKKIAEKGIAPRHYVKRALFNLEADTS